MPRPCPLRYELDETIKSEADILTQRINDMIKIVRQTVGCLTAFQAMWRPLRANERRVTNVRFCRKGLTAKQMTLPAPLDVLMAGMLNESGTKLF